MNSLETVNVDCPYCGENIELLIDCSEDEQRYIEDCEVCCRPIVIAVTIDESRVPGVSVFSENDV